MKVILFLLLILITSCKPKVAVEEHVEILPDTTFVSIPVEHLHITIDENYIAEYPKDVLELYGKWFNEINNTYVLSPVVAFEKLQDHYTGEYSFLRSQFTSEVGEDSFYVLYAHFLKQKNGFSKFNNERKNVLQIFMLINELNRRLQYGGTFFGHQHSRIHGHAEYALYYYAENEWLVKEYTIDKQKKIFLDGLRQRILDEEAHDFETLGDAKIIRRKELFQILDEMDKLIINFFYLKIAQEFQYTHYL